MRRSFISALLKAADENSRIWLLVGDLGFGVVEEFANRFPTRFVNTGVAEQNMTGVAAGLASCGKIVFTYSIGNFSTLRCLEQIRNDVCYHELSVNIVSVGGGYTYGPLGMSHHATEDLAVMRSLPCMKVVAPGTPLEAQLATEQMIEFPGPHYLRLGPAGEDAIYDGQINFQLGRAVTVRDGNDMTIISTGAMLTSAVKVADRLSSRSVHARVLSMHTLSPIDSESILGAAQETGVIVTVEEHSVVGGLGGAVAEVLAEAGLAGIVFKRMGLPRQFCSECGSREYLLSQSGMSPDAMESVIMDILRGASRYFVCPEKA